MTRGPHMSLRWTKPLYVGQNSLTRAQVLKWTVFTVGVLVLNGFIVED